MGKMRSCFIALALMPMVASANALTLDETLRATYTACVGIDDELADLKKMAGINTAVTAAGAAAGAGAIATGVMKKRTDTEIAEIEQRFIDLIERKNKEQKRETFIFNRIGLKAQVRDLLKKLEYNEKRDAKADAAKLDYLDSQSKNLGNWRTGLLATNAATNIAGAAIAGTNKVDKELDAQIRDCVSAVNNLRASMMQAQLDGVDITEARTIADACDDYATVDTTKINKRATGAMISSAVGAATGVAGTVTSAMANSEAVRKDNVDIKEKSVSDWDKEKNLNTAANALSGASTIASLTATVFNATQIKAIKDIISVSEKCTGALK